MLGRADLSARASDAAAASDIGCPPPGCEVADGAESYVVYPTNMSRSANISALHKANITKRDGRKVAAKRANVIKNGAPRIAFPRVPDSSNFPWPKGRSLGRHQMVKYDAMS